MMTCGVIQLYLGASRLSRWLTSRCGVPMLWLAIQKYFAYSRQVTTPG